MCGRYTIGELQALRERFGIEDVPDAKPFRPSFNVAPSQEVPVVIEAAGGRKLALMQWGFRPGWLTPNAKQPPPINARAESLLDRPLWRNAVQRGRCLIPADGFYEWQKLPGKRQKQPVYIRLQDKELFGFAGLYTETREGQLSYAIVTCGPNALMEPIHHRMPVILAREDEDRWLDARVTDAAAVTPCLRPYPAHLMEAFPVSALVSSAANDDAALIQPLL